MVSKKQASFSTALREAMARKRLTQRHIAAYLNIAASSVSRKMRGKHPWTADEQDKLTRWLSLDLSQDTASSCLEQDPMLEVMTRVILGVSNTTRPEIYKLNVSVMRGLQDQMTPSAQEAYRTLCALVG